MSTLFGNLSLVLAALVSSALVTSILRYKPPHGGSGGAAAFPIWMLLVHAALLCLFSVAAIAIARKGGFDWISPNKFIRYLLVVLGLLSAIAVSDWSASNMEHPGAHATWVRAFSKGALVGIPFIFIVVGFILLHSGIREAVPVACYKWPLTAVLIAGLVMFGAGAFEWFSNRGKNPIQEYENSEGIKEMRLAEIDESDATENRLRLLEFTGAVYHPEVRAKASAKIKSYPDWEAELMLLLAGDQSLLAFNFLAINEVDDKKGFLEPVRTGIFSAAEVIRYRIQGTSPSNADTKLFLDEVDSILRTLDQFKGLGMDYGPAVKALRAALDEPLPGTKIKLEAAAKLDEWIQK